MRLVFSEPLEPGLARLALVGPGGTTALAAAADPRDAYAIVAPVEDHLAPGAYRVLWRVVSADGPDYSASGCGPAGDIDQSSGSGWGSDSDLAPDGTPTTATCGLAPVNRDSSRISRLAV